MSDVNLCQFIGRLGKDPEVRHLTNGRQVTNFSLASTESWKDKSGDRQERTEWVNVVIWDKLSEICQTYLSKGDLIYISGRMQTRKWEDKEGNSRYTTEIVADQMQMLNTKKGKQNDDAPHQASSSRSSAKQNTPPPPADDFDDDIPF